MIKQDKNIKISWRMYQYAPESFRCSVNGKAFPVPNPSRLGVLLVEGKAKEVHDEIKRMVRNQRKEVRRVTIGFYGLDRPKNFFYTSQLYAKDDDLQGKLYVYKEWKRFCKSRGGEVSTHTVTTGNITPFGSEEKEVVETHDRVDFDRPLKIYFR